MLGGNPGRKSGAEKLGGNAGLKSGAETQPDTPPIAYILLNN